MAEANAVRQGPPTMEEALTAIQAKLIERDNVDSFKVRVHRLSGLGGTPTLVASLEEANIEQLANPEQWLPMLAGGGPIFMLSIVHAREMLPFTNYRIPLSGPPKVRIDPAIVKDPNWKGPTIITYPSTQEKIEARPVSEVDQILKLLGTSPSDQASGSRGQEAKVDGGGSGLSDLAKLERRMEMDALARQIEESRKKTEETQRALHAQLAALSEAVRSLSAQPKEAPKSLVSQLADLTPMIAAIGSLVTPLLVKSREMAAEEVRRHSEESARQREREDKSRDEMMKILAVSQEKASAAGTDMMKIVSPLVEAVSAASRVTLQNIATMRELSSGEPPADGFMDVLKAGIGALGEVMAAKAAAGPPPGMAPPRQLPAALPVQPPPAPVPPPAGEQTSEAAREAPASEQQSVDEEEEDAAQKEWLRSAPPEEVLRHTTEAIQREHDPNELAEGFLDAMQLNPGVGAAVQQARGPLPLFRSRLGDPWVMGHVPYVQKLVAAITLAAKRRQAAGK